MLQCKAVVKYTSRHLSSYDKDMTSSVVEKKDGYYGRACVDGFDGAELAVTCPVLHERVEVCVALGFDVCVA